MITEVRTPTKYDISSFQMRKMDAEECIRGGTSPREAVARSVEQSDKSLLICFDDEPAAIWGYRTYPISPYVANVWMLTTMVVEEQPLLFVKEMRRCMVTLDAAFISYHAMVLRDYIAARRLLKLLHFTERDLGNPEFILLEKKGNPKWVN